MAAYKGESGRNGFRQGEEHLDNKATKDEEKSILWAHSVQHHNSREDMVYMMSSVFHKNTFFKKNNPASYLAG